MKKRDPLLLWVYGAWYLPSRYSCEAIADESKKGVDLCEWAETVRYLMLHGY